MDRLELIGILIENYEETRYQIPDVDPVSYIETTIRRRGMRKSDLVKYLGTRSRVSEVMSRKRNLSLSMIRALRDGLGIPADVLLRKTTQNKVKPRKPAKA
jgi:HTH-type transcriptional regulator/antitoxin HigA